ncbi:hypothetical protein KKG38_02720 [Patescibacteria group bacterium]|nr:hypothetical protein [Patescibacteria group bacterium]MBU1900980.1 hypothetical protein [Patescibacteria group bacterium]
MEIDVERIEETKTLRQDSEEAVNLSYGIYTCDDYTYCYYNGESWCFSNSDILDIFDEEIQVVSSREMNFLTTIAKSYIDEPGALFQLPNGIIYMVQTSMYKGILMVHEIVDPEVALECFQLEDEPIFQAPDEFVEIFEKVSYPYEITDTDCSGMIPALKCHFGVEWTISTCTNGLDDDCDGLLDEDEPDCAHLFVEEDP